ncbi:ABC transporter, phosphonate, substrate-binding protein [Cognatiyoonia sediminum]|uniref:ABC transporter, phosphonate, substrate-binding protein n=1 Tax=Cognatiyoonia sediminum TaxID=1508389 RepID=A0A1M5L5N3_9RHOB|nr:PhnD/SsuA/transferrin family substrate-binding protein [Cognatiyoonia sediminum]SHG59723.1 ABC transporter, phosphonate, substrate-binding protein [Cognatiyoonia sediminum]
MIASLPMYWREETADGWLAFWDLVREGLPDLPDLMSPDELPKDWSQHWLDAELALSMTCGLPFRTMLRDKVQYVGTLTIGPTEASGHYRSAVVTRAGQDLNAPLTLAYNSGDSQSGWAASQTFPSSGDHLSYGSLVETGSHAASLHAVASGHADVAFLDEVTWRLLQRYDKAAQSVAVQGYTGHTPALPLIAALGNDVAPLRAAITHAAESQMSHFSDQIGGDLSFNVLNEAEYFAVPLPTPPLT